MEATACCYAAMILADEQIDATADKLQAVLKAAKVEVPAYWVRAFAKFLETHSLKDMIANISAAPAAAATGAVSAAAEEKPKEEEKKEEEEEEEEEDFGFAGLF